MSTNPTPLPDLEPMRPALDQLKDQWNRLEENDRDTWRDLLTCGFSPKELRDEVFMKFSITLKFDLQLERFRAWVKDQDRREDQARHMRENEDRLRELHPDWNLDRVREEVLRQAYFEALCSGNFNLGLATMTLDYRGRKVAIELRKLTILEKKAAAYNEASEVYNSPLTQEQKDAAFSRIFGTANQASSEC